MAGQTSPQDAALRTASCSCGGLSITVTAPPVRVHACCCLNCQKESGSSFTYTAFFDEAAIAGVDGDHRRWGQSMGTGQGGELNFCPTCGARVFLRLEGLPGVVGIAVGYFSDPDFQKPATIYWWRRHHRWLPAPAGVETQDTQ
ncbi:MAG: GFA family protein [Rhodospirillaceae bacterium]|nr:GFA family protein [Rhodospirillaceae bacterium]